MVHFTNQGLTLRFMQLGLPVSFRFNVDIYIQSVLSKKHALCESPQALSSIFFLEREREPDFKNKETLLLKLLAGC